MSLSEAIERRRRTRETPIQNIQNSAVTDSSPELGEVFRFANNRVTSFTPDDLAKLLNANQILMKQKIAKMPLETATDILEWEKACMALLMEVADSH